MHHNPQVTIFIQTKVHQLVNRQIKTINHLPKQQSTQARLPNALYSPKAAMQNLPNQWNTPNLGVSQLKYIKKL